MFVGIGIGVSSKTNQASSLPPEISEFIINGALTTDTDWVKTGGTTITGGQAVYTGSIGGISQTMADSLRIGNSYETQFNVVSNSASVQIRVTAGADVVYDDIPGPGVLNIPFVATAVSANYSIRDTIGDGSPGLVIDDITLYPA